MSLQDGLSGLVWKPGLRLKSAGRGLLDLVFPPLVLDTGPRPLSPGLSTEAWMKITFIDGPVCDGCGAPFEYALGPGARCVACEARPRAFSRARAACLYDETSRDPILQFKHADRQDLAPLFVRWISRAADQLVEEADAIAPVPLHRSRLFSRRFNQAAEIARGLARLRDRTYLPDALVRRRATESQGGKSGSGRQRNVAGAFDVPPQRARQVAGRNILLVDDVLTTGATAQGCARALLSAGAARVDLAVVARVKAATTAS
jgi:ComF family protein